MAKGAGHALGLDREIGTIEAGKRADLIVVATGDVRHVPGTDPYSTLVYACGPADVRMTMVDGEVVAESGQLSWADRQDVAATATSASIALLTRAGLR